MTVTEILVLWFFFLVLANEFLIERVARFKKESWPEIMKRIRGGGVKAF